MAKPKVLIAEELSPATVDALGDEFNVVHIDGTDRKTLLKEVVDASAILIRSATQIDEEVFTVANDLKVVARAGVGLDNVDVASATNAGVMVVNAPTSNVVSAAELAIGHLLALARHIPDANQSLKSGLWQRSKFTGAELFGKTIGIIGLGRIGALVATRLAAFDVNLVGYDPYVSPARAAQLGVQLHTLEEVMRFSDFITIHIPRTPETIGMVGTEEFAVAKPNLRIVNASRGGIIDEDALYEALKSGKIAGAGLDVFVTEPPTASPLLGLDNLIVTPHLGASTDEAQEKAGISVAKSVRLALQGELVPDAVNVAGGLIDPSVRPGIAMVEKLGQVFAGLADAPVVSVDVEVRGEIASLDVGVYKLAALKGIFAKVTDERVSFVNAPVFAKQRGIQVRLLQESESDEYRNLVTVRGGLSNGRQISVSGTLTGQRQIEKLVEINGYGVEVLFDKHFVVFEYEDRPGVVATYGKLLGEAGINIAGMQIGRTHVGGKALSILTVDSQIPEDMRNEIKELINADWLHEIDLLES